MSTAKSRKLRNSAHLVSGDSLPARGEDCARARLHGSTRLSRRARVSITGQPRRAGCCDSGSYLLRRRAPICEDGRHSKHSRIVACYFGPLVLPSARVTSRMGWCRPPAPLAVGPCSLQGGAWLAGGILAGMACVRPSWEQGYELFSSDHGAVVSSAGPLVGASLLHPAPNIIIPSPMPDSRSLCPALRLPIASPPTRLSSTLTATAEHEAQVNPISWLLVSCLWHR